MLLNVATPHRSDGTLNRGLVCVAHQTWIIKIPTSLRKRIFDSQLIQIEITLTHLEERCSAAASGHQDSRLEFFLKGAIKYEKRKINRASFPIKVKSLSTMFLILIQRAPTSTAKYETGGLIMPDIFVISNSKPTDN